ncbi:MAG: response regulator transcription factor [Paucibacter sp.]|nr:response regulator transcription factor [Roseateles sp.]
MKKILCIEDERDTALLIQEEFESRGYWVSLAFDGQQGLMAILRDEPDLVLCDVNMPVMSGFALLDCVVSMAPRFSSMPFIFLTALANRDDELKGRKLGADDYVTKPIDFEILNEIITARLAHVARDQVWPKEVELSVREIEALTWAARGKTSLEIAELLGMSKRTVDFHLDNARDKLGVSTRIQAAVKAASGRIIRP